MNIGKFILGSVRQRGLIILGTLLITNQSVSSAFAESLPDSYNVSNGVPLALGRGFNPSNLYATPPSDCITYTRADQPGGWSNVRSRTLVVNDFTSLLDSQNVSVEAHVQNLNSSADASFKEAQSLVSSSRNVSIVVQASAELPNTFADNPQLKPKYSHMLAQGNLEGFRGECGSRFVRVEHRGVSISAVISIVDASDSLRKKTAIDASGAYHAATMSASAKVAFDQEIASARVNHRYEVNAYIQGGVGLQGLADLVRQSIMDSPSLDKIGEALAKYMEHIDASNAVTLGVDVANFPDTTAALQDPWTQDKGRLLRHLVDSHAILSDRVRILDLVIGSKDPRFMTVTPAEMVQFRSARQTITAAVEQIRTVHNACMRAKPPTLAPCSSADSSIETALGISVPGPIYSPRGRFGLAVLDPTGWHMLSDADADDAFASPLADNPMEGMNLGTPTDYLARLGARVAGVHPSATFYALAYLIDAENLASVDLRATSGNQSTSLIAWGKSELNNDPSFNPRMAISNFDPSSPYSRWIVLAVKSISNGTAGEQAGLTAHVPFFKTLGDSARLFVLNGGEQGEVNFNIVARDTYADSVADVPLFHSNWDTDKKLGVARLTYNASNNGRPDIFYITGLNDVSASFPKLQIQESWSSQVDHATKKSWLVLSDKWNTMNVKVCSANAVIESADPSILPIDIKISDLSALGFTFITYNNGDGFLHNPHRQFTARISSAYRVRLRSDGPNWMGEQNCSDGPPH